MLSITSFALSVLFSSRSALSDNITVRSSSFVISSSIFSPFRRLPSCWSRFPLDTYIIPYFYEYVKGFLQIFYNFFAFFYIAKAPRKVLFVFSIFCQKSVQCFSDAVFRIPAAEPIGDLPPSEELKEAIIHNKPYLRFGNRGDITFEPVPLGDELFSLGAYLIVWSTCSDFFRLYITCILRRLPRRSSCRCFYKYRAACPPFP